MSDPKTKTVLGRVFTWNDGYRAWQCAIKENRMLSLYPPLPKRQIEHWTAELHDEAYDNEPMLGTANGPTEADAILALQSTLRKMALLEVADG